MDHGLHKVATVNMVFISLDCFVVAFLYSFSTTCIRSTTASGMSAAVPSTKAWITHWLTTGLHRPTIRMIYSVCGFHVRRLLVCKRLHIECDMCDKIHVSCVRYSKSLMNLFLARWNKTRMHTIIMANGWFPGEHVLVSSFLCLFRSCVSCWDKAKRFCSVQYCLKTLHLCLALTSTYMNKMW